MANKRIIELQERTSIDMGDWLIVDSSTSTRKLSLATLFNYMTYSSMIFVTELPTTDISTTTIYLVPHSGSTTDWDEYIYRDNEWIQIGTSTIDLSAIYQTKTDNNLQTTSKQIVGAINELNNDLNRGSVSVTGTSGETFADTLLRLLNSIDASKVTYKSHITILETNGSYRSFDLMSVSSANIMFGACGATHANMFVVSLVLASSGCEFISGLIPASGAQAIYNDSTSSSTGAVITLYY